MLTNGRDNVVDTNSYVCNYANSQRCSHSCTCRCGPSAFLLLFFLRSSFQHIRYLVTMETHLQQPASWGQSAESGKQSLQTWTGPVEFLSEIVKSCWHQTKVTGARKVWSWDNGKVGGGGEVCVGGGVHWEWGCNCRANVRLFSCIRHIVQLNIMCH